MVAAYSRGMKLVSAAGGRACAGRRRGALAAPDARVRGCGWSPGRGSRECPGSSTVSHALVDERTKHGKLTAVTPEPVGRRLVVALRFTTGDARSGSTWPAQSADAIAELVERETGGAATIRPWRGRGEGARTPVPLIEGRGRAASWADVVVPRALLAEQLRASRPADLVSIRPRLRPWASHASGTQNHLVQAANGLAAVFLACGQDVAYLTESADRPSGSRRDGSRGTSTSPST